jgi:hypothetical protein
VCGVLTSVDGGIREISHLILASQRPDIRRKQLKETRKTKWDGGGGKEAVGMAAGRAHNNLKCDD